MDASDFYSEKYWVDADEEVEEMEEDDIDMVSNEQNSTVIFLTNAKFNSAFSSYQSTVTTSISSSGSTAPNTGGNTTIIIVNNPTTGSTNGNNNSTVIAVAASAGLIVIVGFAAIFLWNSRSRKEQSRYPLDISSSYDILVEDPSRPSTSGIRSSKSIQ